MKLDYSIGEVSTDDYNTIEPIKDHKIQYGSFGFKDLPTHSITMKDGSYLCVKGIKKYLTVGAAHAPSFKIEFRSKDHKVLFEIETVMPESFGEFVVELLKM